MKSTAANNYLENLNINQPLYFSHTSYKGSLQDEVSVVHTKNTHTNLIALRRLLSCIHYGADNLTPSALCQHNPFMKL